MQPARTPLVNEMLPLADTTRQNAIISAKFVGVVAKFRPKVGDAMLAILPPRDNKLSRSSADWTLKA